MRLHLILAAIAGLVVLAPAGADAQSRRDGIRVAGSSAAPARSFRSAQLRPWVGIYGNDLTSSRRFTGNRRFDRTRYVPGIGTGYFGGYGGSVVSRTNINFINQAPDPVPATLGIRAAPVGEPVVYVLNTRRDARRQRSSSSGPRVISMDGSISQMEGGARIVQLSPR